MIEWAKENEDLLCALVITGLWHKKRKYNLTIYADAVFMLCLLYDKVEKSGITELAERLRITKSTLKKWMSFKTNDPIGNIESRDEVKDE